MRHATREGRGKSTHREARERSVSRERGKLGVKGRSVSRDRSVARSRGGSRESSLDRKFVKSPHSVIESYELLEEDKVRQR